MKLMKVFLALALVVVCFPGCAAKGNTDESGEAIEENPVSFDSMSDPGLPRYIQDKVYDYLPSAVGEDYFVENVEAVYWSQEYIDDLVYNSQANVYFGYTLDEIEAAYQGSRYVFTLGDDGETVVRPFEAYEDALAQVIEDVSLGSGVILLCVTVSAVTGGAGMPAASMIFAVSAKTGAIAALSSGALGGISAGIFSALEKGDIDEAMKDASLAASEGFKWGAVSGAVLGGAGEAAALRGVAKATSVLKGPASNGLSMNQAAQIQKESKYPLDVIKLFGSMEQYEICKNAGLVPRIVNGKTALVRDIDLTFKDEFGRTNLQRMREGLAAIDPKTGRSYELHHAGQKQDSTLAILTPEEHRLGGNHKIWHSFDESDVDHGSSWTKQRKEFWVSMAEVLA